MKTLRDFWNEFDGVVDFFNKNGEEIDDMDYLHITTSNGQFYATKRPNSVF